jgi:RimJ/RimL family protein N-acetyltransferase
MNATASKGLSMPNIDLSRAVSDDIPFIMACERRPGYEEQVGRWEEGKHLKRLADADYAYLIGSSNGVPRGFVILRDLLGETDSLYLKRIATYDANLGFGKPFIAAVTDWVFAHTRFHRFWLEVVEENVRALHVYKSLGWTVEGRVREAFAKPDGTRGSYIQMSTLKFEWPEIRAKCES